MSQMSNNKNQESQSVLISVTTLQQSVASVAAWLCEYSHRISNGDWSAPEEMLLSDACQLAAKLQQDNEQLQATVVLPAELATLQNVSLPAKNQRQAMQALPFVVEEQLAVDIEKVHLAVGVRQQNEAWSVVVIDAAIMDGLLQCCEQSHLRLSAVYVDAQLLPASSKNLAIAIFQNRVLLRSEKEIAVFELHDATAMVHFFLGETTPSNVTIYCSAEIEGENLPAQQLATEFAALGDARVELKSDVKVLNFLLLEILDANAINLLQGKYFVRQPSASLSAWRWVVAIAICFWLGQCLLQVTSGWYFSHNASVLEEKMDMQFKKFFPNSRKVGGVRKQIESQLLAGGGNSNTGSFAKVFSTSIQVLNAMSDHQGFDISELRYDDQQGQLEFEVKAKSIDQLDRYKQALSKSGLTAKISSANEGGDGVEGRMQISKTF